MMPVGAIQPFGRAGNVRQSPEPWCGLTAHAVQTGASVMFLEPFKLRDHHLTRRDQQGAFSIREGIRQKDLRETGTGSSFRFRIVRRCADQVVDHPGGLLDALIRHATAMGVAQQEAARLGKLA
jgi:hypothetical protein